MIEEETESNQTAKQVLSNEVRIDEDLSEVKIPNLITVKQNNKFFSCQTFLYLTVVYFLAITIFYLLASLTKAQPINCQLICNIRTARCQCLLRRVNWNASTYIQLSWEESQLHQSIDFYSVMDKANMLHNNNSIPVTLETESQSTCFPSKCLALLGLFENQIAENTTFSLSLKNMLPFSNWQKPEAVFRQKNPQYPQLSTIHSLGIHLVFSIIVGVITFLRKHIPLDFKIQQSVQGLQEKQKIQKAVEIPFQIHQLNEELNKKYQKALRYYLELSKKRPQLEEMEQLNSVEQLSILQ